MAERPLQTLNLIGKNCEVQIPSSIPSTSSNAHLQRWRRLTEEQIPSSIPTTPTSNNAPHQRPRRETEEHHRQLCLAASTFTLWPPTTSNKRQVEMLEEINHTKHRKVAQLHDFDRLKEVMNADESHVTLNLWPSEHHQLQQQQQWPAEARRDRALYEIKKDLKPSDLNGSSRLLLRKGDFAKCQFDEELMTKVRTEEGLRVTIVDDDIQTADNREYQLIFKQHKSSTSYIFKWNWIRLFVNRRQLKEGDEIGLHWDPISSKFHFSVLNRAPPKILDI